MAYVTIEEVASYLAEHGYATWTELTTRQMLTESGMWTRLQSNYDSAHAIDSRYITFPTVDLSAYATEAAMKAWVQSQGYATTVPSLSGYATQQWVQQQGYLTQHQSLSGYATQSWVTASIQTAVAGFASQSFVQNNYLSKATFNDLFEKVNIGTEQSPVYVIHAKLGLYSDSFISAGGVGSSGGGGGGGSLTWDNLDAATNEQINVSHLTTALSGYLTSYGNRPSIGNLSSSGVTWLSASAYVVMPLVYNAGAGYYQLNLSSYAKTSGNNTFTGSNTFKTSIEFQDKAGIDFFDGIDTWNFFIDFSHDSRGSFCWCTAGQDIAWLDCDGVFHASGYQNSSDLRRKTLFGDVALSVADIASMPAVRFRWNSGRDTQAMHVGTIAQAWQALLPEVVLEGSDGLLSMDYASAALVSVINVAKSVSDHERRILDLEAENKRLKEELEQLKAA